MASSSCRRMSSTSAAGGVGARSGTSQAKGDAFCFAQLPLFFA